MKITHVSVGQLGPPRFGKNTPINYKLIIEKLKRYSKIFLMIMQHQGPDACENFTKGGNFTTFEYFYQYFLQCK